MNELAPGSLSLEDENPSLESLSQPETPPPTPDTPAPPVDNAAPAEDAEPEGTVVNPNGEKLVPLNVVADLRGKVRDTKAEIATRDAKIAELEAQTRDIERIRAEWQVVQPLIQQLKQPQSPAQAPAGPLNAQEALEYAKDLDLYKADGTPDVDRAQRLAARQQAIAQTQAQALVQPLYANTAQAQSSAHFEQAANFKDKNGVQVDRDTLKQIWSMVPAELSAQPGVAGILYKVALAESITGGKYKTPVQAPPPPVITESLGGGTGAPKELSTLDRAMMSAGQIKSKDYEDISARFKPGATNVLE